MYFRLQPEDSIESSCKVFRRNNDTRERIPSHVYEGGERETDRQRESERKTVREREIGGKKGQKEEKRNFETKRCY